jgi:hypothetical protein
MMYPAPLTNLKIDELRKVIKKFECSQSAHLSIGEKISYAQLKVRDRKKTAFR